MTPVDRPVAILIGLEVKDKTNPHTPRDDERRHGRFAAVTEIGVLIDMTTQRTRSLPSDVGEYWLTMGLRR